MTDADGHDESHHRLDIVQLLDERFRLREDPERQSDLQLTHERLKAELRHLEGDESPDDTAPASSSTRDDE
jgi:hypothetical protein